MYRSARRLCETAHLALAAVVLALGARGQAPTLDPAPWPTVLRTLVESDAPAVRGEAALALGELGDPADLEIVAKIARERAASAAIPATIGLGHLAVPGVEVVLGELFDSGDERRRQAAALAFGLLPDNHPAPVFEEFLDGVPGGSYQRNETILSCWLTGILLSPAPSHRALTRYLIDDPSNRQPGLRLLAYRVLARMDGTLAREDAQAMLESDFEAMRRAGLELAPPGVLDDRDGLARIAAHDRDPRVRASALERLVAERAFAALEISADAIESSDPDEIRAGERAMLAFGGHILRRALERRILSEREPERATAMIEAWRGPCSHEFVDGLLRIGADARAPTTLRRAALCLVGDRGDPRALPLLRSALVDCDDIEGIAELMHAIERLGAEVPLDPRDELVASSFGRRLAALANREPERATAQLSAKHHEMSAADLARCLHECRTGGDPPLDADVLGTLPPEIRRVL